MDELLQDVAAEKERIEDTLKALHRKRRTSIELAAIGTYLHNVYSGMENALKRILKHYKIPLRDSSTFHKDLLALAVERRILSTELAEMLDEYRAFRHYFVHGYGVLLQEAPMLPLAQNLPAVWNRFELELTSFLISRNY
jgi:uncharacterized protein YutE (UPF0331/DUF86 family)